MLLKPDEDLFEGSKMSFGDHLEELRTALLRSLIALVISVALGFTVAQHVVRFIQSPLQEGLETFRKEQSEREFGARKDLSSEEKDLVASRFAKERLLPELRYIDPAELEAKGWKREDETSATDGMLPLTLYYPVDQDPRVRTIGTGIPDAFMVYVKAAVVVGVVLASPAIFYFLWSFVASGMYSHERNYVYVFMPFSMGLFLLGAAVAFFFVFHYVLQFLFGFYGWLDIDPTPRIGEWLNFALLLPLGFGLGFQLPLVMLFLERIGVFSVPTYLEYWRWAILVIFILSMILTPADPQSMLLMAMPLTVLYFGGIGLCYFMPKRKTPFGDPIG